MLHICSSRLWWFKCISTNEIVTFGVAKNHNITECSNTHAFTMSCCTETRFRTTIINYFNAIATIHVIAGEKCFVCFWIIETVINHNSPIFIFIEEFDFCIKIIRTIEFQIFSQHNRFNILIINIVSHCHFNVIFRIEIWSSKTSLANSIELYRCHIFWFCSFWRKSVWDLPFGVYNSISGNISSIFIPTIKKIEDKTWLTIGSCRLSTIKNSTWTVFNLLWIYNSIGIWNPFYCICSCFCCIVSINIYIPCHTICVEIDFTSVLEHPMVKSINILSIWLFCRCRNIRNINQTTLVTVFCKYYGWFIIVVTCKWKLNYKSLFIILNSKIRPFWSICV